MFIGNRSEFYSGTRQFIAGLALHEQNLTAVAAVCTVASLNQLYAASRARQQLFQQTRDGKREAFDAQRDTRAAAAAFIEKSRDALVLYLGSDWSEAWTQAGFINHSLAVPTSIVDTLEALQRYFTENPAQERADLNVTSVFARQTRENLELAVATVARCKREQRTNRDLRKDADAALAEKLSIARKVLAATLPEGDARWLDFRADVPGDLSRPEGVEWEAGLPGHLTVRWNAAVRAESYVVQAQVVGVDETFRSVATVRDTSADVVLTPGAQVNVRVLARNAFGPGVPSDEAQTTVPPLAEAA